MRLDSLLGMRGLVIVEFFSVMGFLRSVAHKLYRAFSSSAV